MKKYLKRARTAAYAASATMLAAAPAFAQTAPTNPCTSSSTDTFCQTAGQVSFGNMSGWVTAVVGSAVIGIAMAFAAIKLSKRGIKSV